jgi:hypothetical protein
MHLHVQRLVSVVKMATVFEVYYWRAAFYCGFFMGKRTQCKEYSYRNVSALWWEVFVAQSGSQLGWEIPSWTYSKLADNARPGHPVQIATEATVQQVEELIQADKRVTTVLGCSHSSAYSIMHDRLKFWKVCPWLVPRDLKDQEKMNLIGLSLQHLLWYADEGEDMLNRIITGNESWVHHYQPKSKHSLLQWKHPSSPSTKKFKVIPSTGKVMLTVFWYSQEYCKPLFRSIMKIWILHRTVNLCWSFRMQFAENIHVNWLEGYCFIMTMPDPIQNEQPRKEFKYYSGNFLIIWFALQPEHGP